MIKTAYVNDDKERPEISIQTESVTLMRATMLYCLPVRANRYHRSQSNTGFQNQHYLYRSRPEYRR